MPTYEYQCDACGHAFEKFQSITAAPDKKCPACGKNKAKRLIGTGAGLIFKGSGFYITDYRDKGYAEKAKADGAGGAGGDAKSDGKPDAKPDAKPASNPTDAKPAASASDSKPAPKPDPKPSAKSKRKE